MAISALYVVALVVAAAVVTQASFTYTEEDLASDDSMWALYERWAAHHEVVRDPVDKARRFPIFKDRARRNLDRHGNKGRQSAINIFGDRTFEEILRLAGTREESDQDQADHGPCSSSPLLPEGACRSAIAGLALGFNYFSFISTLVVVRGR